MFLCSYAAFAQTPHRLTGTVIDSLKDVVSGADVFIIADKDTLSTVTNTHGRFIFSGFKADKISLLVMSVGFKPYTKSFQFKQGQQNLDLDMIVLDLESNLLNEVVINGMEG
ncbi:carboxypeptidase-like regulatory domain-containing protein [Pedobacter sp. NJ-S-72]